jgi:hypothetical protein
MHQSASASSALRRFAPNLLNRRGGQTISLLVERVTMVTTHMVETDRTCCAALLHQQVVTGIFNYHAVPTNSPSLEAFRYYVTILWRRSLRRRSQKDAMTWERMTKLANDWLLRPRILHPWPSVRFAVRHPRWEPYA